MRSTVLICKLGTSLGLGASSSNLFLHGTCIPCLVTLASHRRAAAGLALAVTEESHELAALVGRTQMATARGWRENSFLCTSYCQSHHPVGNESTSPTPQGSQLSSSYSSVLTIFCPFTRQGPPHLDCIHRVVKFTFDYWKPWIDPSSSFDLA